MFWYLQPGDTALELVLKAKRGALGLGSNSAKQKRLVDRLMQLMHGMGHGRSKCLDTAIRKAMRDMGQPKEHFAAASACLELLQHRAVQKLQVPPFATTATSEDGQAGAEMSSSKKSAADDAPTWLKSAAPSLQAPHVVMLRDGVTHALQLVSDTLLMRD